MFSISSIGTIFQKVGWLAVKLLAEAFKGAETYSAGFASFENREVGGSQVHPFGQLGEGYFALGHHYVEVHYYHNSSGGVLDG